MKCPFCIKKCSVCGKLLVANTNNFYKAQTGKYGLLAKCKNCESKRDRKKLKKDNIYIQLFQDYPKDKTWNNCPFCIKICSTCGKLLVANTNNFAKKKGGKYGVALRCKACDSVYQAEYYIHNIDDINKKSKEYRGSHKEEERARTKKYRENNKEKIKLNNHIYYLNNRETILKKTRKYWKKHKDNYNKYTKNWYKRNPEYLRNKKHQRKAYKIGNGLNKDQLEEMLMFFNYTCAYSGEHFNQNILKDSKSDDHIVPLIEGGEHEPWNIIPVKFKYNSSKGSKNMLEWYKQQKFFTEERLQKIYEWQEYAYKKWR